MQMLNVFYGSVEQIGEYMSNDSKPEREIQRFTFSYKQAIEAGIDYRDFKRVRTLPRDIKLTAVAGIWGDYQDIRCLFTSDAGDKYCRTVYHRAEYYIPEISVYAKNISPDDVFNVD